MRLVGKTRRLAKCLTLLIDLAQARGYCFASNAYLAKRLEVDDRTVTRYVTELQRKGLILVACSRYQFGIDAVRTKRMIVVMQDVTWGIPDYVIREQPPRLWATAVAELVPTLRRSPPERELFPVNRPTVKPPPPPQHLRRRCLLKHSKGPAAAFRNTGTESPLSPRC